MRVFFLLIVLAGFLEGLDLQTRRIKKTLGKSRENSIYPPIYSDIHFLLIASANVHKVIGAIRRNLPKDSRYREACNSYKEIYKRYKKDLEHLDWFRDNLEHITQGRIDGKGKSGKSLQNKILGSIQGEAYHFGGREFDISACLIIFSRLRKDIEEWNEQYGFCPAWDLTGFSKQKDSILYRVQSALKRLFL